MNATNLRTIQGPLPTRRGFRVFQCCFAAFVTVVCSPWVQGQSVDSTGPVVRSVVIRGNSVTQPRVIFREMALRPGIPVTPEAVEHDKERIYNLQIFNRVDIEVQEFGDSADVHVAVDERWYVYPFPVLGLRNRDPKKIFYGIGVTHQNLAGLNQKLFFEAATGYDQWVQLSYRNPRFLGEEDVYFEGQVNYAHLHPLSQDGAEFQQVQSVQKISLGKRFGYYRTLVGTIGTEYWEAPNGPAQRIASSSGHDYFITSLLWFIDDQRDVREYAMEGSFLSLWIAKDGFGESAMNITRVGADLRKYLPIAGDWSVAGRFYTRLTTGGVVPSYRHIFLGYDERIRGSFLTVREGEHQFGGNMELRIPLLSPRYYESSFIPVRQFAVLRYGLYGAIFIDAGKVFYRNRSFIDAPLYVGAGAGLHWILPYGIIVRTEAGVDFQGREELILDFGASF